jgi:hypothetical protein
VSTRPFKAKHLTHFEDGQLSLDFNTAIPMPKELEDTISGSTLHNGLIVLGHNDREAEGMLNWELVKQAGVTDIDGLKKLLLNRDPDCRAEAERHLKVKEATGYLTWRDWACDHWGTTGQSNRVIIKKDDGNKFVFQVCTAWTPPVPVLEKLVTMWPQLTFSCEGVGYCEPCLELQGSGGVAKTTRIESELVVIDEVRGIAKVQRVARE